VKEIRVYKLCSQRKSGIFIRIRTGNFRIQISKLLQESQQ